MSDEQECPVCLEVLERAIWCHMPCDHRTCFRCFLRMWEHSRNTCPLCRHDVSDCMPTPTCRVRSIARLLDEEQTPEEAFDQMIRRMQVSNVMENALRDRNIAPRNALRIRRTSALRIVVPASDMENADERENNQDVAEMA